jgi:hypothetical protein
VGPEVGELVLHFGLSRYDVSFVLVPCWWGKTKRAKIRVQYPSFILIIAIWNWFKFYPYN